MDKPISMPVKEYLVKVMSIKMNIPSATIDAIITHQFEEANKAMLSNNSVEIAGFGKFLFKEKKATKKLEKAYSKKELFELRLTEEGISEAKSLSNTNKLNQTIKDIEVLKKKLHGGIQANSGGVEEQPAPTREIEGNNTEGV
jgi:nucleoid DNA-binding protein